ncbi:alpha/beta fold hydrolase [Streptomyces lasiicapitis]|uniref:alpha/beta fold hydrolase n=1 Tax=Streptomyces lasiicapitis TaxID=1923961 RepID=UPI0036C3658C
MFRRVWISAALALGCVLATAVLTGCEESSKDDAKDLFTGTGKIDAGGRSVHVSCAGRQVEDRPVVVLLSGGGDGLEKLAALRGTLSKKGKVCSYDRLGEGASDKPAGPQTLKSTGKVLSAVLDRVAGDGPVVLAGHSLGGLIAGRYAPDHQDRVKGLVLMDATSPTQTADLTEGIPESAPASAAALRDQTLSILGGGKPELLTVPDGKVRSAGDVPVEVLSHGKQYLAAVPEYGPGLERAWSEGQRKWLALSGDSRQSTAAKSGHYVYVDEPDLAVRVIERVTARAAADGA